MILIYYLKRGITQRYILSCGPCRKSLTKKFARKYVSFAGIPLTGKVDERHDTSNIEHRVQILETLLQDYYLDDHYLKEINEIKKIKKREKQTTLE